MNNLALAREQFGNMAQIQDESEGTHALSFLEYEKELSILNKRNQVDKLQAEQMLYQDSNF
jgi:hypothetical protein